MQYPGRRLLGFPDRQVELAVIDWGGAGPLALLAHATGFCASALTPMARQLRSRYRVIGYDHRGHGNSTKLPPPEPYQWNEFILDLLAIAQVLTQELGLPQVALGIGHSVGACCLLAAAARHPGLFERIALLDPVIEPPVEERTGFYAGEGKHPRAEGARKRRAIFASRADAREKWLERRTFSDWHPDALQGYLEDGFRDRPDGQVELQCSPEIEAAIYEAGPDFHIFREVEQLRTPTTLYRASRSPFRLDLAQRLTAHSEYLKLVAIDGEHLVAMTSPDVIAERLLEEKG